MPVEDGRLARVVGDTQYTPATDRDTQVVAGAAQDSTDNTRVGFRVLLAMDHCHVELRCTLGNHTVRLIAATGDEKSIDETTARSPGGTYVLEGGHVLDNSIRGSMRAHRKEGNVPEGEDPWLGGVVTLSRTQAQGLLEATSNLC